MNTVTPLQDITLTRASNGIGISWPDGHESFFHHLWLRDCCYCELCGNSYSSKRYFKPSDIALDIRPHTVALAQNSELAITWPDGHASRYKLDWLRVNCYSDTARVQRFHRPTTWNASISHSLPTSYYGEVSQSDQARLDFLGKIRDYGFVVVRDGPREDNGVEIVANLVGEVSDSAYGKVFDLTPRSQHKTLGNTFDPVPPHTDEAYRHAPPGINVLHCVRPAETGGASVLVDGFNLGNLLREANPEGFHLLATQPQPFHRIVPSAGIDQRTRAPVFVVDEYDTIVGYRFHTRTAAPLDVPAHLVEWLYATNHQLSTLMMDERNHARFRLESGDTVLFDNHRVMHAREGFDDPNRMMRICNVSREQFHEQLRLLAADLGFNAQSNQIMSAGVNG